MCKNICVCADDCMYVGYVYMPMCMRVWYIHTYVVCVLMYISICDHAYVYEYCMYIYLYMSPYK